MRDVVSSAISRRHFLKKSLAIGGGVMMLGARAGWTQEVQAKTTSRWAFVSDTHIPADVENNYRGFYPYRNFEKIVEQVAAAKPDGTIITGDFARLEGLPGDYENAKKLIAPLIQDRPACIALGNHDHHENFAAAFSESGGKRQPVSGKHVVTIDAGPVQFIVLDSLFYTNQTPGLLGKNQRLWLTDYLTTSDDKPTILFFHHPPSDEDGDLLDTPRLFDIIAAQPKIKAIVCGHWHIYSVTEQQGITVINLPATGYNFTDIQPVGWIEATLTAQGCQLKLNTIAGNTSIDGNITEITWRS